METLQSTIFIEFDVNTKKITFLRGDGIIDYDSNVTSVYVRVKYKNLSGNTVYLTPSELEDYKFSLFTMKPATNNVNVIIGEVTDELKENVYGGVIKFEIPRACTNRLGIVKCEIHINQGNKIIASSTFVLDVKQSLVTAFDDSLLDDEDFPVLKQLILEIQKASNINDSAASSVTTYSSNKIENIKNDISSQIKENEKTTNNKLNLKRDKSTKITNLDLDISSDENKIKLINLSDEVKQAIAGDAPIYASVEDRSIGTTKYANDSITYDKIKFPEGYILDKDIIEVNLQTKKLKVLKVFNIALDNTFISVDDVKTLDITSVLSSSSFKICYIDKSDYSVQINDFNLIPTSNIVILFVLFDDTLQCKSSDSIRFIDSSGDVISQEPLRTNQGLVCSTNDYINIDFINNKIDATDTCVIYNGQFRYPDNASNIPILNTESGIQTLFYDSKNNIYLLRHASIDYNSIINNRNLVLILSFNYTTQKVFSPFKVKINGMLDYESIINDKIISRFSGKKVAFLGDSISNKDNDYASKNWNEIISEKLSLTVTNWEGRDGSTISATSFGSEPMCNRYVDLDDDADLVFVWGGTNDFGFSGVSKGTMFTEDGITPNKDTTTWYGAINTLLEGLLIKYSHKDTTIILMTPMPRSENPSLTGVEKDTGMTLRQMSDVMIECAKYYSIPILDLNSKSRLPFYIQAIRSTFSVDGLHPNDKGHQVLAQTILGFLNTI